MVTDFQIFSLSSHYYPDEDGDNGGAGIAWGISGNLTGDVSKKILFFK